jgi:hypothetical protein
MTPHNIHAGKNEPRILKDGAREHPAANSIAVDEATPISIPLARRMLDEFSFLVTLRPFCMMEQVSRLKG